jgi:hypothetical protein
VRRAGCFEEDGRDVDEAERPHARCPPLAFPAGDAIVPPWSPPAGNLHHPDLFVQPTRVLR